MVDIKFARQKKQTLLSACCPHYHGTDVHDREENDMLLENEVTTVEPGIYISGGSTCDKKWWNIGVCIEDDILIIKNACEVLSGDLARKPEDVEKLAAQKNRFNEMNLSGL